MSRGGRSHTPAQCPHNLSGSAAPPATIRAAPSTPPAALARGSCDLLASLPTRSATMRLEAPRRRKMAGCF
eukprot:CAMPEP_0172026372 /NCGR_PEP_ID=MMETSP1041-20130122/16406_1 /TAXON_ID=464988 /ORGANISM="Hemiselmis andersenii, Strain CCMP439" /LENGTH=70 /DNA_ID=CAMNT_0012682151 /DNA_START=120 /DNA_END=329 /DNA_ORIENTATION=+